MKMSKENDLLFNDAHSKFHTSLGIFIKKDCDLLQRNTNERSITHKLAEYLQILFPQYNVDCEYNRWGNDPKKLVVTPEDVKTDNPDGDTVFPDIIVHERGWDAFNLLVIEVKKSNNLAKDKIDKDKTKLFAFTTRPEYLYCFGLMLILPVKGEGNIKMCWIHKGQFFKCEERKINEF